jgi:hypothetical protein
MLNEVTQCIGWNSPNDRATIIRKEQLEQAIPKLQLIEEALCSIKGGVGTYVRTNGIQNTHDVLVILRRLSRLNGHAVIYRRASKNNNNKPVYLYNLI